jgi:hypothetical protein
MAPGAAPGLGRPQEHLKQIVDGGNDGTCAAVAYAVGWAFRAA